MKAESWNFKRHPKCSFTMPEELVFVDRYQAGDSFQDIAEDVGVERQTIWKTVTRVYSVEPYQTRGYPGVYDINTEVFKDINNEKSMYALGLLATDGFALADRKQLHFNSVDKEQIENLKECLNLTKDPLVREPRNGYARGRKIEGKKKIYQLRFGPPQVYDDFLKYFPPKSRDMNGIPGTIKDNEHANHFVRGVLDGDGCASNVLCFTGKYGFLEDVQAVIITNCDIGKTGISPKNNSSDTYDLRISGRKQLDRVYKWLYGDANYFLSRKKAKFTELVTEQ